MKRIGHLFNECRVVFCLAVVLGVLSFVGCNTSNIQSIDGFLDEYVSLFPEEHKLESAIQHVASALRRRESVLRDAEIPELEERIFDLIGFYQKNESGIYTLLREVHTTFLYPSLSEKRQKFLQKVGRPYIYIGDSRRIKFFDPSILWVDTRGIVPDMKQISAAGTLVFEVVSKNKRRTITIVFEINYDHTTEDWEMMNFTHKVW